MINVTDLGDSDETKLTWAVWTGFTSSVVTESV